MRITKKNNKRIDHVQKGLKADSLWLKRPIKEASELANVRGEKEAVRKAMEQKQCKFAVNKKTE